MIHFVGDLHQPLHTTTNADEGGNCVPLKYFRRNAHEHNHSFSPNLHSIWDTAIPERDAEGADSAEYADTLDALFAADIEGWQKAGIHVEDWVWEGYDFAESVVYGDLDAENRHRTECGRTQLLGRQQYRRTVCYTRTSWLARRIRKRRPPWRKSGLPRAGSGWR